MPHLFAILLLCSVCAALSEARAGAWMREEGRGFASGAARFSWPQDLKTLQDKKPIDQYFSLYFEYGMSQHLTLGLDLGRSVAGSSKTIAFAQFPLRNKDRGMKASMALGFGRIDGQEVLRPGLSVGWGLKSGWLSADGLAEIQTGTGQTDVKLDVTWGFNLPKDRKVILQVQTGKPALYPAFARIETSYVIPVRERLKLDVGAAWGVVEDQNFGLKMGFWTEF